MRRRKAFNPHRIVPTVGGTMVATEGTNQYGRPIHQSYATLTAAVDAAMSAASWADGSKVEDVTFSHATFAQAAELATKGWREGSEIASRRAMGIVDRVIQATTAMATDERIEWEVTGSSFDVGAYLSGEPECWIHHTEVPTKKAISLMVNAGAHCGVSAEVLQARGIAIATLVIALQSRGYPVTVDVVECSHNKAAQSLTVRVIDANGSQIDVDRLVYALAHPSMLRCIMANAYGNYWQWGHGCPDAKAKPPGASPDIFVAGINYYDDTRWTDEAAATEWVIKQYTEQTK